MSWIRDTAYNNICKWSHGGETRLLVLLLLVLCPAPGLLLLRLAY
jgi:hypothetical protein